MPSRSLRRHCNETVGYFSLGMSCIHFSINVKLMLRWDLWKASLGPAHEQVIHSITHGMITSCQVSVESSWGGGYKPYTTFPSLRRDQQLNMSLCIVGNVFSDSFGVLSRKIQWLSEIIFAGLILTNSISLLPEAVSWRSMHENTSWPISDSDQLEVAKLLFCICPIKMYFLFISRTMYFPAKPVNKTFILNVKIYHWILY